MFCKWGRTWWMPRGSLAWTERRRQSPQGREKAPSLPPSFLWAGQSATSEGQGARALPSYPVAVLQEAGEVAVRGLEANEV